MSTFISNGVLSNGDETINMAATMSDLELKEVADALRELFDDTDEDYTVDIDGEEFTAFEFAKAIYDETIAKCQNCDNWHLISEMVKVDDDFYCEDCQDNLSIMHCEECGDYHFEEDMVEIVGNRSNYWVCDDCYADGPYHECDHCGDNFHHDNMHSDDHGNWVCDNCYEDHYVTCDNCGRIVEYDESYSDDDGYYCDSCWNDRVESSHIHGYGYKPTPDYRYSKRDNRAAHPVVTGIELEFNHDSPMECKEGADDFYNQDKEDLFYLKHDGSLEYGYEAVSHPASLLYWREHHGYLESLLDTAESNGAIAGEGCGLHIHVCKNAMTDVHKMRLQAFINENADNLTKIARRTHSHWAKFKKVLEDLTILKQDINGQPDRYEALNWLNRNTVEFRFFRSTLSADTLLACIELVHAAYVFTKNFVHFNDIRRGNSWQMFLDWIDGHDEYEELCDYYAA